MMQDAKQKSTDSVENINYSCFWLQGFVVNSQGSLRCQSCCKRQTADCHLDIMEVLQKRWVQTTPITAMVAAVGDCRYELATELDLQLVVYYYETTTHCIVGSGNQRKEGDTNAPKELRGNELMHNAFDEVGD